MKISKLPIIGLCILAIIVGLSGYFYSKHGQTGTYYLGCDGNKQSVKEYNSIIKMNADAAGPNGINPGGLCIGTGPYYESVVTRPILIPALCIAGAIVLVDCYLIFRLKHKT